MSDVFSEAAESLLDQQGGASQQTQTDQSQTQGTQEAQSLDQAIFDLEKAEKFTFGGREWTRDGLKALIDQEKKFQSMDKDYTTKMQTLSKERKSFEENSNYYKNLHWDLPKLVQNPSLIQEFIQKYPPEFHKIAAEYLKANQPGQSEQQRGVQNQPTVDVDTLSRLERLEKLNTQREIRTHEQEITNIRQELNQKFPNVNRPSTQKMILAEAYELLEARRETEPEFQLTKEDWEQIYKQVSDEVAAIAKADYGDLVKKQTEANSKAKGVAPGGGTAAAPPVKFKKFDQIDKHVESLLSGAS